MPTDYKPGLLSSLVLGFLAGCLASSAAPYGHRAAARSRKIMGVALRRVVAEIRDMFQRDQTHAAAKMDQ
jgi:hypothetical protein